MSQTEVQLIKNNAVVEADIANDAVTRDKINVVSTSSAPGIEIKGDDGSQEGYLQLNCRVNSHGVKIQSPPHSASQSYKIILPDNQIAADKFLKVKSITGSGSTATGQLEFSDVSAGKILQVKNANKPDQLKSTSTSFIDVASLSVDISAASSTNKMLVTCHVFANCEDAAMLRLMFDSTPVGNGQSGSSADVQGFAMVRQDDGNLGSGYGIQILHTPGDTSSHTYKIQARTTSSSHAININRRNDDNTYGLASSITVMEVEFDS